MGRKRQPDINVAELVSAPLVLFFCETCHWLLIERGGRRRQRCPKCSHESMVSVAARSLDEVLSEFSRHQAVRWFLPERALELRAGIAEAVERFTERQADWAAAVAKAGPKGGRALVAAIYRRLRKARLKEKAQQPVHAPPPDSGHEAVTRKERLDWLHAEDREKEIARVAAIKRPKSAERTSPATALKLGTQLRLKSVTRNPRADSG